MLIIIKCGSTEERTTTAAAAKIWVYANCLALI